jgi:hypothetical protein
MTTGTDESSKKKAPKPRITKLIQSGMFYFIDIDPVEIARQLTLIESNVFTQIRPQGKLENLRGRERERESVCVCVDFALFRCRIVGWTIE